MTINVDKAEDPTLTCPYLMPESYSGKILPTYLLDKAKELTDQGKDIWIRDGVTNESHNYENFEDETKKVASALFKKGFRKGDTVIYMPFDMVKLHLFFVGVWRANGTVRALYPEENEETLLAAVEESRVGWIYCEPEQAEMCLAVSDLVYWDVEIIITHGEVEGCTSINDFFDDDGSELPDLNVSPTDVALLLCTSGTTGRSKAAAHTHETVIAQLILAGLFPWSVDKPNLVLSKATHVTGAIWPLTVFCKGGSSIVMARVTKENMFKAVHIYKPLTVFAFPTLLIQLAIDPMAKEYDLSSLEIAFTAGAPCTPPMVDTIMKIPKMKDIIPIWGLTEVLPLTVLVNFGYSNSSSESYRLDDAPDFTVGKLSPGVEMQCRDPESGSVLGPNEKGELCVKAPSMFVGYFLNEKATLEAFVDGFFRTGDMGYYDENGYIFLIDRLKEIFKYRGNHISPTEIEEVISRHPAVAEVCVVGIPDPESRGHVPRAFVTKRSDFDDTTAEEIKQFANDNLAVYKHLLGGLFIIDSLPKGKTGKITRILVEQLSVPEN